MSEITFTEEQSKLINLVQNQITAIKNNDHSMTFLGLSKKIIVQGKAGTGKSILIQSIANNIINELGPDALLLLAPTGVAAVNIVGATIHSQLHIPKNIKEFSSLKGAAAREFCNKMKNLMFLILEEYSMIVSTLLGMIEQRCRQGTRKDEEFGGLIVFLFGDIKQLPPVLDTPLYGSKMPSSSIGVHGKLIFKTFQACLSLTQVQRQQDDTFKSVLTNISSAKISDNDYNILQNRFINNISQSERTSFADAIQLHATKDKVQEVNLESVRNLRCTKTNKPVPIARICAKHNSPAAINGSIEDASFMSPVLYLGQGMKIMCKANLWTHCGLVNGSIGIVTDIVYEKDSIMLVDMPVAIICNFSSYKGPHLNVTEKLIPIPAITTSWTSKSGETFSKTQFPLVLAYACSIHKSQGLTLDKAIIDIGSREIATGLTYVALSRVKSLKGILLIPFAKQRLLMLNTSKALLEKLTAESEILKQTL